MTQEALLAAGIAEMGLNVTAETQQKLLAYLALLQKWNKVYNLTAVRDPLEMVTLHLLDSLSVLPYVKTQSLLDVGSGGGLPGIALAICQPAMQVTTIDTVQKNQGSTFLLLLPGSWQTGSIIIRFCNSQS